MLLFLFAGLLFPLGFMPINLPGIALLSAAIFFYQLCIRKQYAFRFGFCYGVGKYLLGVSWIYLPIAHFSNAPIILAVFLSILFILFLSLYEGLFAYAFNRLSKRLSLTRKGLLFSALGTLIEWLRAHLFTGFPWLTLGYSQTDTPLSHFAPLIGSYGLSFLCYGISATLALAALNHKKQYRYLATSVLPFMIAGLFSFIHYTTPLKEPFSVSLVQANIEHQNKWSLHYFDSLIERYDNLTEKALGSELIIWPETALSLPNTNIPDVLDYLENKVDRHHSQLLLGIPYEKAPNEYTNAMLLLGKKRTHYDKRHLVPFGEYVPLSWFKPLLNQFNIPFPDLKPGLAKQPLLHIGNAVIAPFICYEIAFANLLKSQLPAANLLVTISDDSWYEHSLLKGQHLQIAKMRSLESQKTQLFEANTGLTAIIDHNGQVIKSLSPNQADVLRAEVSLRVGATPWSYYGDNAIILLILFLAMPLIFGRNRANHFM